MYVQHLFTVNCSIEKTKIKKKEADNASLCCSSMFVRYNKVIFSKKAFVCFWPTEIRTEEIFDIFWIKSFVARVADDDADETCQLFCPIGRN